MGKWMGEWIVGVAGESDYCDCQLLTDAFVFVFFKFVYFCLHWVLVAVSGLFSSCAKVCSSLICTGFSMQWRLLLQSTGSKVCRLQQLWHTGSGVAAYGFSCPEACGIFLDQGSNPSPLHRHVDSQTLDHREVLIIAFVPSVKISTQ